MPLVAGIDVAGPKRGFHGVLFDMSTANFLQAHHWAKPEEVVAGLRQASGLVAVAIDCPPRANRLGSESRAAERELHGAGIRVQWTRAPDDAAQDWMLNGASLWLALQEGLPGVELIESFPTAVAKLGLSGSAPSMPLHLVSGALFKHRADILDACLCAWTAARWHRKEANCAGRDSADGEIWY